VSANADNKVSGTHAFRFGSCQRALLRLPDSHFFVFLPSTPYGLDTLTPTQRPGSKTR
jgi:hypothetical protein